MRTKSAIVLVITLCISFQSFSQTDNSNETKPRDSLQVTAEKFKLSGWVEMNYHRHYLWRGAVWGSNDVSQPELHFDLGKFWIAGYTNLNLRPKNLSLESYKQKAVFDEQDVEAGYHNQVGEFEYEAAVAGYFYFNQLETPNTAEATINLKYPVWKDTKVFTETSVDIGSYRGAFYTGAGLDYEKEIKSLVIEAKVYGGTANNKFNNVYYGVNAAKVDFIGGSLNLQYSLPNNLYVALNGEYNRYIDNEVKAITGLRKSDNFSAHFGITF